MTNPLKISKPRTARHLLASACSAALLSTMVSTGSYAQDESSFALEEVIVTARKRDESLQDTPVAVSALTKELKEASLRRIEDVQDFAPNVYIRRTPGIASGAAISIRGVNSSESDKSFDPAVGVVMDGMFLGTSSGVLLQNFDIKRIEILRGPQGTLFGKNTTGGVLNIIRGDVTMEWDADISATFDENGREDFKGVVNVPIIDEKLGVKLFGAQIKSDGFVKNTTLNEDVGGDDMLNYGFAALWRPTENFDLKFHYERLNDESDQGAYVNVNQPNELNCAVYGSCESNTSDNADRNSADGLNDSDNEYDSYIATANYQLGDFLFTYIGSSRDMDEDNNQHFDGSSAPTLSMRFYNDWEQESHELRVASSFGDNFDFILGAYLWDVDYEQRWDVAQLHYTLDLIGALTGVPGGAGLTPSTVSSNGQVQSTESKSVFGQADWRFAEKWTLTLGARWTEEEKDFTGGNQAVFWDPAAGDSVPGNPNEPVNQSDKWDDVTPKVGLSWDASDDMMVYGSYTEGFKSGGFFGRQSDFNLDVSYEPEFVETWEAGLKSTWIDGRMTFNPVFFYSEYSDKQEQYFVPVDLSNVASLVANAAGMEIYGLELELEFQITEAWNVRANYGYLDAEYDGFVADINGDGVATDNDDFRPINTPENTFGVATTYIWDMGNGSLSGNVGYHWRDKIETILAPDDLGDPSVNDVLGSQDSLENLSANLSYTWNDRYKVAVFGRNLTDDTQRAVSRIGGLTTRGWWNEGRTYGMELSASF
ncbi:MAG: iron complex outermembrane receptor protein [Halieaceae bacterium]|jgi:iron complex outermembrane receptor protein